MDREEGRTHRGTACNKLPEPDFLLQWGNRKRLRCVKIKEDDGGSVIKKKLKSRIDRRVVRGDNHTPPPPSPYRLPGRGYEASTPGKSQSCSPEKEDRYYTTRGSLLGFEENGKMGVETDGEENGGLVWPKLFISLSSKEKEEDFIAMEGCKLPQRPKKRAKLIQRSLLRMSENLHTFKGVQMDLKNGETFFPNGRYVRRADYNPQLTCPTRG